MHRVLHNNTASTQIQYNICARLCVCLSGTDDGYFQGGGGGYELCCPKIFREVKKSQFPPRQNSKISFPSQNHSSPGKKNRPPQPNHIRNFHFSPKFWGEIILCGNVSRQKISNYQIQWFCHKFV